MPESVNRQNGKMQTTRTLALPEKSVKKRKTPFIEADKIHKEFDFKQKFSWAR